MNFINECKKRSYKNRLGRLTIEDRIISNKDNLQNFEVNSGCYIDGIIGSVYSKHLKASFNQDIKNLTHKKINVEVGIKNELEEEYLPMGEYLIENTNNEITENMSEIEAYDILYKNLDKPYICHLNFEENITVKDLYIDICNQLEVIPETTYFLNNDIPITSNPFTNQEKNRTVLQTIAKIACSFIEIDNVTNQIKLSWLSNSENPDYTFYKEDYSTLEGGEIQFGPINTLIIKNSQIDSENVTIKDEESIELNGEHSIIMNEDYLLYNETLREQAISSIWNRVKGMKYVDLNLTTYYGKPFLKLGDKIRIYIDEKNYFDTYVLNHTFTYDGTFKSVIESKALTEEEIKTKQDFSLGELLKNTEIEVNKQKKTITTLIEEKNDITSKLNKTIQNIDSIQNLFQITGGNNLIKNSVFLLNEENWILNKQNPLYPSIQLYPSNTLLPTKGGKQKYEYGYDTRLSGLCNSVSKIAISNGLAKNTNITGLMIGNQYTLSYKVKNEENTVGKIRLEGNTVIYNNEIESKCDWKEYRFSFIATSSEYKLSLESSSINESYTYFTDLMLNSGDIMPWEPSSGEIISTVLKMSQLGLQIFCTGSEIATLMTSEGFEVRRFKDGNLYEMITSFTSRGMDTKLLNCEEINQNGFIHRKIKSERYDKFITYKGGV